MVNVPGAAHGALTHAVQRVPTQLLPVGGADPAIQTHLSAEEVQPDQILRNSALDWKCDCATKRVKAINAAKLESKFAGEL